MIEDLINGLIAATKEQTEATKENSALLREAIAISKNTYVTSGSIDSMKLTDSDRRTLVADTELVTPKPRGKKKPDTPTDENGKAGHVAEEKTPEPVVEEAPVVEDPPAAAEPEEDRVINDAEAQVLRAAVRAGAVRSKDIRVHTQAFEDLRKEFGVERVTQLTISKHAEFLARLEAL